MNGPKPALQHTAAVFPLVLCLSACLSIPQSHKGPNLPNHADIEKTVTQATETGEIGSGPWPEEKWWTIFESPKLYALIEKAMESSHSIKTLEARVKAADSVAALARSRMMPQVNGVGSVLSQRISEDGLIPVEFVESPYTLSDLSVNLTYNLDWWGKNRSILGASLGAEKAAKAEADHARLLIAATIARGYIRLNAIYNVLDLSEAEERVLSEIRHVAKLRENAGMESGMPLEALDTEISLARERTVALEKGIEGERAALCALVGEGPDWGENIQRPRLSPSLTSFELPQSIPLDIIRRRADLAAARYMAEAASKMIDAAKADFYPNINLVAAAGLQSLDLSRLLQSGNLTYSYGPAIHLPIFHGGELRANLNARRAEYDMAVERYNQTLLEAARDIANGISMVKAAGKTMALVNERVESSGRLRKLAELRHAKGVDNVLGELRSGIAYINQRKSLELAKAHYLSAGVSLIESLGGGYASITGN